MEKITKVCHIKCAAQKARKAVEAKVREEAKKWRIVEEEKKKK